MPEAVVANREAAIQGFLARVGWDSAERRLLAGDASFRKYHRLAGGSPERPLRAVLMDAPPEHEDVRPFVAVARHLAALGYSAPAILAEDAANGFLLIEDLGDDTFTRALARDAALPEREAELYRLAVDVLIDLHARAEQARLDVPPYDDERLLGEAALLTDWYMPAVLGRPTPPEVRADYLQRWRRLLGLARAVPDTLVLRDYHVDNLMCLPDRTGLAACGLLDFQDAVIGPVAYDLVSLTEDARRDVPAALQRALVDRYLAAFPALDSDALLTSYAILGAQRGAKIIGIFTRLMARDGKPQYLQHIPRVWRLVEGDLAHPALAFVREWFDLHLPRAARAAPVASGPA